MEGLGGRGCAGVGVEGQVWFKKFWVRIKVFWIVVLFWLGVLKFVFGGNFDVSIFNFYFV